MNESNNNLFEKTIEKRKENILNWFKNPYNLAFAGIIVLAIVLYIYYFIMTKNQPLWWDEAEYMSGGAHIAFGIPYEINPQRPILFQLMIAILLKIGFGENAIKFILSTFPGVLVVFFSYLLAKEMYGDKRIALITSFIMSVLWIMLFYSMRIMTDSISFTLILAAYYFFWKGKINEKGKHFIWLVGPLLSIAFMIRIFAAFFGIILIIYLLFTEKTKTFKDKNLWISFGLAILLLVPFGVWYTVQHGSITSLWTSNNPSANLDKVPIAWYLFKTIPTHLELPFFIFFIIGLITCNLFLSLDIFLKEKNKKLYADFFNILLIIGVISFFVFYLRAAEDRWMMPIAFGLFVFSAKGIIFIQDFAKLYLGKNLALILILIILGIGGYYHISHSDMIIKNKLTSYSQVRDAGFWLKEHTNPNDIIMSMSETQITYYSERKVIRPAWNETEHYERIKKYKPKYIMISIFEAHPEFAYRPREIFSNFTTIVNVYFADAAKTQPILIIYEVNQTALEELSINI